MKETITFWIFAVLFLIVSLVLFVMSGGSSSARPVISCTTEPAVDKSEANNATKININTASLDELVTLDGIGPAIAQRIIDYRNENGGFDSVEELNEVSGIGDKTLEELLPYICI